MIAATALRHGATVAPGDPSDVAATGVQRFKEILGPPAASDLVPRI